MRARRTDNNHASIARAFERMGCVVHRTNGDWDLTVRLGTAVELIEVKNPETAYGKRGQNERQKSMRMHREIVRNMDDVARVVSSLRGRQRIAIGL